MVNLDSQTMAKKTHKNDSSWDPIILQVVNQATNVTAGWPQGEAPGSYNPQRYDLVRLEKEIPIGKHHL